MIQSVRENEIKDYRKLAIGRAFERAFGNWVALVAGLVCFIILHFTDQGKGLSGAKIFATLELLVTARLMVFLMGISIGFLFELVVIFERFATIYNIQNKKMIEIDELTKVPIEGGEKKYISNNA